jgi:cytochrome P450
LCLTETELIKEFLSKYSTVSGKSWLQKQGSKHFIGEGVLMANGENWYHQRHIVAPAFMGDRLKVLFNHILITYTELDCLRSQVHAFMELPLQWLLDQDQTVHKKNLKYEA